MSYLFWDDILEVEESQPDPSPEPVILPSGVRHVLTLVPLLSPANRSVPLQPGSLLTVAAIKGGLFHYRIPFTVFKWIPLVSLLAHRQLGRAYIYIKIQN